MKNKPLLALFVFWMGCNLLLAAEAITSPTTHSAGSFTSSPTTPATIAQALPTVATKTDKLKELDTVIYSDGSRRLVEDIKKATKLDYIDQPWFFSSWLREIMKNRDEKSRTNVLGNGACTDLESAYSLRYYAKQFHNNLIVAYQLLLLSSYKAFQTPESEESFNKLIAALEEIYTSEPSPVNQ